MSAHTPGPLRVLQNSKDDSEATQFLIATDGTERVLVLAKVGRAADADELVRRFNAHDDLLAFAHNYLLSQDPCVIGGPTDPETCECVACVLARDARAAIAKAEGKS